MTDFQRQRVQSLRKSGIGYAAIASELQLPLGTVKAFCRREKLQNSDLMALFQGKETSESSAEMNLLYSENRGNTVVSESSKPIENIEAFKGKRYRVSVSFSEKPDESAQHDVLTMLMNLRWKE